MNFAQFIYIKILFKSLSHKCMGSMVKIPREYSFNISDGLERKIHKKAF